jgi:anaerobic magnesium-protoporphyrin IX monomethyl ester cyclase
MTDIVLTNSFLLRFDPKQHKLGQPYAPLGTLYAASVLRKAGYNFRFHDPMFSDDPESIRPLLAKERPRILIIYEDGFSYLTKMCLSSMQEATFRMIRTAREFGCRTIIYSLDASDHRELYLEKGADFIILGEGENTLRELVGLLILNPDDTADDVNGIVRIKNGRLQVTFPRELITDPDEIPFPAWDLLDIGRYSETWKKKNRHFVMNMVTTRGCPYNCIWCAKPVYGNHYSSRSPRNVVEEMLYLKENCSPDHIWFADDIFGLRPGWTGEFATLSGDHHLSLPYTIQSRADLLADESQIRPLVKSGCRKVWLGIESGSQKILDAMQKGITVEQVYAASKGLRKAGMDQAFFLQLGFPGETREDIHKTIRLLTDLMPEDIGISVTYPLPGTKFYDSVKNEMQAKVNWKDSDDLALLFPGSFSPTWYKTMHRFIHKYFRYRQSLWHLPRLLTGKEKATRNTVKRIILFPHYFLFSCWYRLLLINPARK